MKRPLFTLAFLFALFIWLLVSVLGADFFRVPFSDGEKLILEGQLLKTETKGERIYCYLQKVSAQVSSDAGGRDRSEVSGNDEERLSKVLLVVDADHGEMGSLLADEDHKEMGSLLADEDHKEMGSLRPGNKIRAEVTYEEFRRARNLGNYDEAQYYHSLGVKAKFHLNGELEILSRRIFPLRCAMRWVKGRLSEALDSVLDSESHADIFLAILTGDRSGLNAETKDLYRKSGIAHILAISGLHISFIGMSLFSLLRKRMRFSFAALISAAVMICFCIMSGESASAVRATIMFLIRLLALKFGKSFDLLSALGLSGILILIQNPMYLYHSGFQLSFSAILGIGLLAPVLRKHVPSGAVLDAFVISLSVTLVTLPVIINTYYEIPVFSVLLNLLVVPMMGLVLESGVFGVFLGIFSVFLGRMLIGAGVYMVTLIEFLCALSDRIPFSILITGHISGLRVALYYMVLTGIVFAEPIKNRLKGHKDSMGIGFAGAIKKRLKGINVLQNVVFVGPIKKRLKGHNWIIKILESKRQFLWRAAAVLCTAALLAGIIFIRPAEKQLQLSFFDVDQGDGILIESPAGIVYMIDGGSTSVTDLYRYRLESALKYKGIHHIDYALITHTDTDHISGVLSMLEDDGAGSISIGTILLPLIPDDPNYEELTTAAEEKGVHVETLCEGMSLKDSYISFDCLYPPKGFRGPDSNSYSAVLSMTYGSFRALFTGDLDEAGETYLLSAGHLPDFDLLKVAHHGSKFSTGRRFLEAVRPDISVISAGIHNSYGHPHEDVLKRLKNAGSEIYVTAESGEICVTVDEAGAACVQPLLV